MYSELDMLAQKYTLDKNIVKQYKLTKEEHEQIYEKIKTLTFYKKTPLEVDKTLKQSPTLSIIVGQPGCGKSSIIQNEITKYPNENVVVINSDDIKLNHPNYLEIGKKYLNEYSRITGLDGDKWTEDLFNYALDNYYNTIFEIPLRNDRIKNTILKAKEKGFKVKIVALSVSDLKSRIGIYDRYIKSKKHQGFGRFVGKQQHDETYNNMPKIVSELENIVDDVEVYIWDTDKNENRKENCIYTKKNKKFPNAKVAIEEGRKKDRIDTVMNNEKVLGELIKSEYIDSIDMKRDLLDILNEFEIELNRLSILDNKEDNNNIWNILNKSANKLKTQPNSLEEI